MNKDVVLQSQAAIERMGDEEIYLEIVRYFSANLEQNMNLLSAALEGEQMEEATRLAHSLKGNCATIGAERARESSALLEQFCRQRNYAEAMRVLGVLLPELRLVKKVIDAM